MPAGEFQRSTLIALRAVREAHRIAAPIAHPPIAAGNQQQPLPIALPIFYRVCWFCDKRIMWSLSTCPNCGRTVRAWSLDDLLDMNRAR